MPVVRVCACCSVANRLQHKRQCSVRRAARVRRRREMTAIRRSCGEEHAREGSCTEACRRARLSRHSRAGSGQTVPPTGLEIREKTGRLVTAHTSIAVRRGLASLAAGSANAEVSRGRWPGTSASTTLPAGSSSLVCLVTASSRRLAARVGFDWTQRKSQVARPFVAPRTEASAAGRTYGGKTDIKICRTAIVIVPQIKRVYK